MARKKPEMPEKTPKPGKAEKTDVKVISLLTKERRPGESCALCGHWSVGAAYGLDDKTGYCDRWEKLTDHDFWCDEFISRERYQKMQDQLAEEHEEHLDEDT